MREWIFHFCRNALRLPMGVFLRKVHFEGLENFTKDVPVLLACNHPNSFLDGVIFEHFSNRRVYTLARGDAFNKPVVNYIFRGMRLLPIFRATDAAAEKAREGNARTKDEIYEHFKKNHIILIFSEGIAYPEKAVRRLKKGTGQIAADMAKRSDFEMDLHVVPTSLNYSKFGSLMQTVHVHYGEPIRIRDYAEMIKNDEKGFVEMVTNTVQNELEEFVMITKGDYTDEKELVHEMVINENYQPFKFKIKDQWGFSLKKANEMSESLAKKVKEYKYNIAKHKVLDANVGNRSFDYISAFVAIITLGVSLPVYAVWALIWWGIDKFVRAKFRNVVFQDSMKVGLAMLLSLVLLVVTFFITKTFVPGWWALGLTVLGIYGAICWFRLIEAFPYFMGELKWAGMKNNLKSDIANLRKEIMDEIGA